MNLKEKKVFSCVDSTLRGETKVKGEKQMSSIVSTKKVNLEEKVHQKFQMRKHCTSMNHNEGSES